MPRLREGAAVAESFGKAGQQTRVAQTEPELLQQLKAAGVLPGAVASLSAEGSYVLVQVEGFGDGLELPAEVAQHVYVAA